MGPSATTSRPSRWTARIRSGERGQLVRVTVHDHQVGSLARLDRPQLSGESQQLGGCAAAPALRQHEWKHTLELRARLEAS